MGPDPPATEPAGAGPAQTALTSAVGNLTAALLAFERVSIACAATLDHDARHAWPLPDAARIEPGSAEPQVRAALEKLTRAISEFEGVAMAIARALDLARTPTVETRGA
jgi:hypothetical protein